MTLRTPRYRLGYLLAGLLLACTIVLGALALHKRDQRGSWTGGNALAICAGPQAKAATKRPGQSRPQTTCRPPRVSPRPDPRPLEAATVGVAVLTLLTFGATVLVARRVADRPSS